MIANTLITLDADGQVARTDLTDGRDETGQTARDQTLIVAPDNPNFALVVSDIRGDVTVVDVERDQTASVADLTETDGELIFADGVRINPSGSHVGVAIPQLFQSFVVDLETSESTALAGRVMAIGDDRVVTEQPAGDQAEIEFYALDGERLGSVDVQAPKASLITTDGSMLLIANDGTIVRADPDDAKDVGELTDPDGRQIEIIDGTGAADGERLIASTEYSVLIVGDSGEQIAMFAGRVGVPPTLSSRCLVLATGTSTIGVTVVDLETGEVVAEVDRGFVTATSTDGCTVATSGISPQIIRDGIVDDIDADAIVAVAPDGAAYATITGRRTSLISGDNDPVELASKPALIRFGYE